MSYSPRKENNGQKMQQHSALTLGAGSAVSYLSDHLVAKGVCISPDNMYGDTLRFLFQ